MGVYTNRILADVFKDELWFFKTHAKKLFLTFDDGPTEGNTEWILSTLAHYDARATFFCLGSQVMNFQHQYDLITEEGHSVGNHTYRHLNGWKYSLMDYVNDVHLADHFIDSVLFRPPYGRIKPPQMKFLKKNYQIVFWDVLAKDYNSKLSSNDIINRVINLSRPGSVIVFHDSVKTESTLRKSLPEVLEYFSSRGYEFLPIPMKMKPEVTV
jgi:peptidoglycan/xylan/chitin deacetylase (PgdA/CDA1 family)